MVWKLLVSFARRGRIALWLIPPVALLYLLVSDISAQRENVSPALLSSPRNVCMGIAADLQFRSVYTFVASYRRYVASSDADLVLFVTKTDLQKPEINKLRQRFPLSLVTYDEGYLAPHQLKYHPTTYRYSLYLNYLRNTSVPYSSVLIIDVRDSFFQDNPFTAITEPGFYAVQEPAVLTVGKCPWTSGWVRDCFGEEMLKSVQHRYLVCSGSSIATLGEMLVYLELMTSHMFNNPCERFGIDQGVHVVLAYTGKIPFLHISTHENGLYGTLGLAKYVDRDEFGNVLNEKGEVYKFIHQYDRKEFMVKMLSEMYPLRNISRDHNPVTKP
mmetsp:Transcript_10468/g.17123  ORF Transcript_10468/g.17123 Transcript_10468/m.17123 type:complete len:329 (+) Transcript_10468:174-1160(+)|eukprot:CAMPEP_0184657050 /NCGR_PEP_ID=MMETSP0308-20130426/16938_1 /TAXON_ID=38269 /ORGANISM="Gloeochaete witrockiana, Strain SAG 46.84" /LENGTH=328 /DNA_ID=CAMNT_0027094431 /DNA_START=125 /DNA_END=1111 /DNA_ORIENTATION=-